MKRLASILSILVLVLSCTERELDGPECPGNQPENKAVELDFGVILPEMQAVTKSFASNAITDLHAYVFDASGYLVEHSPCAAVSGFGFSSVESGKTVFKMTVTQTSSPRYIHFVANCPVEVNSNTAYTEYDLIGAMQVSGTKDAYWQRIEFPNGIKGSQYDDGGDTANRLTCIPLVRNFAKITLNVSENLKSSNFKILGYKVIRIPDKGSVAPFNVNNINENGGFARYASYDSSKPGYESNISYNDLVSTQKFVGISPDDASFDDTITDADLNSTESKYLYERNVIKEKNNEPWIIVKAQFGDSKIRYFKLILMNETGDYYNILRNIEYVMTINSATEFAGYNSLEDALTGSPNNGNISYLTETKNLLNISDGSHRLFVSEVEKTIVGSDPVYIYYKYESSGTIVNNKDNVISSNSSVVAGDVISSFAWETTDIPANYPGYAKLKIVPKAITGTQKKQVITISDGNLSREITLWLQRPFDLTVQCNPTEVLRRIGESVEVKLTLDSDLRESMFPLVFTIEAENLSIYPDATKANNKMPVVSGKNITIVPSKTAATAVFQYEKTITWDEYYNGGTRNTEFSCYFKTNKVESASKIYVYNSYFGLKNCEFTNYGEAPISLTIDSSTFNSVNVSYSRTVDIYTAANKYSTSSGSVTMKSSGITDGSVTIEDVKLTDVIYFRYTRKNTNYYASMTVEQLLAGNQTLSFGTTEL